uniref:Uncharacterized protein n=1 Tax=Arundo donax TaxID=35708 RepID=A0A0A9D4X7_ARUDO
MIIFTDHTFELRLRNRKALSLRRDADLRRKLCLYSATITPSKLVNVKLASTCSLENSMHFSVTIIEQK